MTQRCKKRLVKKYNTQSLHILRDHVRCARTSLQLSALALLLHVILRTCESFYAPAPISPKLSAPEISAKSAQLCSLEQEVCVCSKIHWLWSCCSKMVLWSDEHATSSSTNSIFTVTWQTKQIRRMNTNMELACLWILLQLKPTFERLSDDGLLSRCLGGKTQNQNESLKV